MSGERGSEIVRIADELARGHDGDAWHGTPLRQLLSGIDHERAAARPFAGGHSIWELVLHVTAWKNEVRRRVEGAPAGDPAEGDWPPVPPDRGPRAWQDALAALDDAHRTLLAAVARLPEHRLFEPVADPRNRELGSGVSHYVMLHGLAQHDAYHAGQVAVVRNALPPATSAR